VNFLSEVWLNDTAVGVHEGVLRRSSFASTALSNRERKTRSSYAWSGRSCCRISRWTAWV
jgi:hypothetical protein